MHGTDYDCIVYIDIGKNLHYGGVAEWFYRVKEYLQGDCYIIGCGHYIVDYIKDAVWQEVKGSNFKLQRNFGLMEFIKNSSQVFECLDKLLQVKTPIIIVSDNLLALLLKFIGITPILYTHSHEFIHDIATNVIAKDLITSLAFVLDDVILVTQTNYNKNILRKNCYVWCIPMAPEYFKYKPQPTDTIVYTGGFDVSKNYDMVFKVLSKLPDFRKVLFAGRGWGKVNKLIHRYGIKNVEVIGGHLNREVYYRYLTKGFVSFICSHVEAFSITVQDNGWYHPIILPKDKSWVGFWEPFPKAKTVNEYVELIKKFYRDEQYYEQVLEGQRSFIKSTTHPSLFKEQWAKIKERYLKMNSKESPSIKKVVDKCGFTKPIDIVKKLGWNWYFDLYPYFLPYYHYQKRGVVKRVENIKKMEVW